jgi:erythromycin esterase
MADRGAFLKWARQSCMPLSGIASSCRQDELRPLGDMVGDATIVCLSEAIHAGAEPLEFRNRVLEYLVKEKGFTAVAIESGIVESRIVHDYVRGVPGELANVMADGFSWTFDRAPQNASLASWLRERNADSRNSRKVNFYGFDVPGSPGNTQAGRGMETALAEALGYLGRVDSPAAEVLHARLDSLLSSLPFDLHRPLHLPGYDSLTQSQRDTLTAAVADLINLLERQEARYTAASTAADYEWACRAAIGARQTDNWLRQIPVEWQRSEKPRALSAGQIDFLSVSHDVRDRAQADNLQWIVSREEPDGKVLVFASRFHLSAAPLKTALWERQQQVAGTYLRRRFGSRLVTIGNLVGRGESGGGCFGEALQPAHRESLDRVAAETGIPLFLLDLRAAPPEVARWLDQEHQLGAGDDALRLQVARAFDVLFYIDCVTPARP